MTIEAAKQGLSGGPIGPVRLYLEELTMPAADLGAENPLFDIQAVASAANTPQVVDPAVDPDDRRFIGYGAVKGCLPYQSQDDYTRRRRTQKFRAAVLENRYLRATFLLDLGGRLWSLFHKPLNRELLYVNPVFQPANLAIRNAWFSGGVEWNFGWPGHWPLTCAPVFAAQLADGHRPVLRLYEWERVRQMAYQIDAWLSEHAPVLLVRVRLANPHPREVPVYWWSNIAVPEQPGGRVLAPATQAYTFAYDGAMRPASFPVHRGCDISYPLRNERSADYFFRIPQGRQPWIASLDAQGCGLFQTSTARLRGRKVFVWGTSRGARHWQEFLSVPGQAYLEVQAGLGRTQAECLPMPPGAEWEWLEAYGAVMAPPEIAHGNDWGAACNAVERRINQVISAEHLELELRRTGTLARAVAPEILHRGSGWGRVELERRKACGQPMLPENLVFDEASIGAAEAPWLRLLTDGVFPEATVEEEPKAWMVQKEWRELLEAAVGAGRSDHWTAWLHLGVMYFADGKLHQAKVAWETSVQRRPTLWAWRNLAALAHASGDYEGALVGYERAWRISGPKPVRLVVEWGRAMLAAGRYADWLKLHAGLPPTLRRHGQVQLLEAQAALATGDLDRAERILTGGLLLADVREGQTAPTDLWFTLMEQRLAAAHGGLVDAALRQRVRRECPPPLELDFRMVESPGSL